MRTTLCDYFVNEVSVIAENDTQIVIALRLEKAAIERNLALLSALANLNSALRTPAAQREGFAREDDSARPKPAF